MGADDVTLYLGDCLDILPALPKVDAVVTDPPYGINWSAPGANNPNRRVNRDPVYKRGTGIQGDDQVFDPGHLLVLGVPIVLWGANYYASLLPNVSSWIVWDKRVDPRWDGMLSFSDVELAWCNDNQPARIFRHIWNGIIREGEEYARPGNPKLHPNQKPLRLMMYCVERITNPGDLVLDPYMGSGTTGVACVRLGRRFIGVEIDPIWYEIAERRIREAQQQLPLPLWSEGSEPKIKTMPLPLQMG